MSKASKHNNNEMHAFHEEVTKRLKQYLADNASSTEDDEDIDHRDNVSTVGSEMRTSTKNPLPTLKRTHRFYEDDIKEIEEFFGKREKQENTAQNHKNETVKGKLSHNSDKCDSLQILSDVCTQIIVDTKHHTESEALGDSTVPDADGF